MRPLGPPPLPEVLEQDHADHYDDHEGAGGADGQRQEVDLGEAHWGEKSGPVRFSNGGVL